MGLFSRDRTDDGMRTTTVAGPGTYEVRPAMGSLASRMLLTVLGAAGLVIGAFLAWLRATDVAGIHLSNRAFLRTSAFGAGAGFLASAGFVAIVLGLLALLGLGFRTGWLTRLAGALGVVAIVLFGITVFRASNVDLQDIGLGAWISLAGAIVALVGGFMGTARKVDVPEHRVVTDDRVVTEDRTDTPTETETEVVRRDGDGRVEETKEERTVS